MLCEVYSKALDEECNQSGDKCDFVIGKDAEERFLSAALTSFQAEFPRAEKTDENIPEWPECLPYDKPLACKFVDYVGYIVGYKTAVSTAKFYAYCQQHGAQTA